MQKKIHAKNEIKIKKGAVFFEAEKILFLTVSN